MKILLILITLILPFNPTFASDCSIKITGSDMMQYDLQEINISSKCNSFEITLDHGGKLPVSAMGHNIVITEESHFMPVAQLINMDNGIENGYLPVSDKILFRSDMIELRPSFDLLKEKYYNEIQKFINFPLKFGGVGGKGKDVAMFK